MKQLLTLIILACCLISGNAEAASSNHSLELAPVITFTSTPSAHKIDVPVNLVIELDFDADIDINSIHLGSTNFNEVYDDNIKIVGSQSGPIEGTYAYGSDNSIILFTPSNDYYPGERVTVTVTNGVLGSVSDEATPASFSFTAASGPFEGQYKAINSGLSGMADGNFDWGDYDNDGDLDLIITGFDPDFNTQATIYRNDNGNFTDINAGLEGVYFSTSEWADYDNDGDLDVVVAGSGFSFTTTIYQNNGGVFSDIDANLLGVDYAALDWGDYDNDGDLDLVVMGRYSFGPDLVATTIYENDGGVFTDIGAGLFPLNNGSVDWGDYDADGDLDLVMTGFDANWSTRYTIIYDNENGVFTDHNAGLPGMAWGDADWGDYDMDGDLDLLLTGDGTALTYTNIYNNDGGVFTDIGAGLPTTSEGSARWGDYDGDGDLDIVLTGNDYSTGTNITNIYRNDGTGSFTDINANLHKVYFTGLADWADFDGDGDLDILVAGETSFTPSSTSAILYENTIFNAFSTTWKTDNPGSSNDNQITIPTIGTGYSYDIYWEEVGNPANNGTEPAGQTGDYTITFPTPGTYRVDISGSFPRIYFNAGSFNPNKDSHKLLTVEQWGDVAWTSMVSAFSGCVNLQFTASDVPDLTGVTDMYRMFYDTDSFNSNINNWDVSSVTSMSEMFREADSFDQPLDGWDVSNVTDMSWMFFGANTFNQDISSWDISSVVSMRLMFAGATVFNSNLSTWNMSGVSNTNQMFANADAFNQDISGWNMTNVTDIRSMFSGATSFNQDISGWTLTANNFTNLFRNATAFNQDLSSWDVSSVIDMESMFEGATAFNQDLSAWDVSSVQSMRRMFANTTYNRDISMWNVSGVFDFNAMFQGNTAFNQNISSWTVFNATDMRNMFSGASSFDQNLGGWSVASLNLAANMLNNSGLSIENYDLLLAGWSVQSLGSGVNFGARGLYYCASEVARDQLITNYSWTITDEGPGCISVFEGPDITGKPIINSQAEAVNLGSGALGVGKTVLITIQNELAADLTNVMVSVTGTAFNILQAVTTITSSSTLTFDVILTTAAPVGSYTENITITSDNFSTPFSFEITAEITALPEPEIVVFNGPTILDPLIEDGDLSGVYMGNEVRGFDLTSQLTISNIGSADLNISDITFTDPAFSHDLSTPVVIPANGTQMVTITLDGSLSGDYLATIDIVSDDADEAQYDFPISGTILGPIIAVMAGKDEYYPQINNNQAAPVKLGASSLGTDLVSQITVINYGEVDLAISSISISGTAFSISPGGSIVLPGGLDESYEFQVYDITLNANSTGQFTETVTITSDDDANPVYTFDITGWIFNEHKLYWTEAAGNQINRSNIDGSGFEQFYAEVGATPRGLAVDTLNAKIYWTNSNGQILRGDIGTATIENIEILVDKSDIAERLNGGIDIDLSNNKIYWTETWNNEIWRSDLDGANPEMIISDNSPIDIAVDGINGKVYYTTFGSLIETNLDGTAPNVIYTNFWPLYGVDLSAGRLFWIQDSEGFLDVQSVNVDGSNPQTDYSGASLANDLISDFTTDNLILSDFNNGEIVGFDGTYRYTIQGNPNVVSPISVARYSTLLPPTDLTINLFQGIDNTGTQISVGQTNIDLGSTPIGTDIDREFTIENIQDAPVNISSITSSDPAFEVLNAPTIVQAGSSEFFIIRLVASEIGSFSSDISISSDFAPFNFSVIGEVTAADPPEDITVYNALSPNGDNKHDFFEIAGIESYTDNRVVVMNRWGDIVYEASGYNNTSVRFEGRTNNGSELPPGTYYYRIDLGTDDDPLTGFISLRK